MSALSDKIKSDLVKLSKSDKHLQSIIKRLESGNANLADVDDFAQATGTVLKKVFEKSITESPKAFTDEQLIAEILGDIFGDNYELINSVAENIQKQLDKVAGIGIKPQRADFPSERIENLAKVTAQKDLTDKTAQFSPIMSKQMLTFAVRQDLKSTLSAQTTANAVHGVQSLQESTSILMFQKTYGDGISAAPVR